MQYRMACNAFLLLAGSAVCMHSLFSCEHPEFWTSALSSECSACSGEKVQDCIWFKENTTGVRFLKKYRYTSRGLGILSSQLPTVHAVSPRHPRIHAKGRTLHEHMVISHNPLFFLSTDPEKNNDSHDQSERLAVP